MDLISFVNYFLATLTVIGQLIILVLVASLVLRKNRGLLAWVGKHAVLFSLIVASIATLGSLFYSEIAGYEPCKLCWFQRIMMYPQTLLLGAALLKRDKRTADYHIALSVIGALIAGYHYLLQIGAAPAISCSAVGYSVSCSETFVMRFGYITNPMMAFTAFLLIISFMGIKNLVDKHPSRNYPSA